MPSFDTSSGRKNVQVYESSFTFVRMLLTSIPMFPVSSGLAKYTVTTIKKDLKLTSGTCKGRFNADFILSVLAVINIGIRH